MHRYKPKHSKPNKKRLAKMVDGILTGLHIIDLLLDIFSKLL
jgi:hypothetical protein